MRYYAKRSYLMGTFDIPVTDDQGTECFKLINQGKIGFNYSLTDKSGRKLANVKQHIGFSFKPRFDIEIENKKISAVLSHKMKINGDAYCKFTGLDWSTDGNLHHHDYQVMDGARVMARVYLKGTSVQARTDPFKAIQNELDRPLVIECGDDADEPLVLAVVFAIELAERCDNSGSAS